MQSNRGDWDCNEEDDDATAAAIELKGLVECKDLDVSTIQGKHTAGSTASLEAHPDHSENCKKRAALVLILSVLAAAALLYRYNAEFLLSFLAGGIAGAVAKTITAPVERVKLLIQTQDAHPSILSGNIERYSSVIDCFSRVATEQGISAFWRGNVANIMRYFPTQAFNFAFKDSIKALFPEINENTEFWEIFLINVASGGLAGALSLCIVYPLDYARTLLAADPGSGRGQFDGLVDCIQKTVASSGIAGLYGGIGVSIAGIIPYRGVYFGLFDTLSSLVPSRDGSGASLALLFFCAQTSAITAGYISYPFDTVRRRLQMQSGRPKHDRPYGGAAECLYQIVREEGAMALFKGAGANAIRTVGAALVLVIYSEITDMIGAR